MRKFYLLCLFVAPTAIYAQTDCEDANSYIVSAYSHVKDSYDSNNISHLKYYANRSVESFELSKNNLNNCGCSKALDLAKKSMELLAKVENAETFEDGRFFVKRARDLTKESVIEIDKCSIVGYTEETAQISDASTNATSAVDNNALSDLQKQQLELQKQQDALKLKAEHLKTQMAEQKNQELILEKQKLISSYNSAISKNVKTYNDVLKICECGSHHPISDIKLTEDIKNKSLKDIKALYNSNLKTLATNYIEELDACE